MRRDAAEAAQTLSLVRFAFFWGVRTQGEFREFFSTFTPHSRAPHRTLSSTSPTYVHKQSSVGVRVRCSGASALASGLLLMLQTLPPAPALGWLVGCSVQGCCFRNARFQTLVVVGDGHWGVAKGVHVRLENDDDDDDDDDDDRARLLSTVR